MKNRLIFQNQTVNVRSKLFFPKNKTFKFIVENKMDEVITAKKNVYWLCSSKKNVNFPQLV